VQAKPRTQGRRSSRRTAHNGKLAVHESAEGGYEAHTLGHSIHTQAETLDALRAMVKDAVRCHFDPDSMPRIEKLRIKRYN